MIVLEVVGLPAPQGSKTRMPNGAMVEGGSKSGREKHRNWRSAVAEVGKDAVEAGRVATLKEPVAISVVCRFPPTKADPHRLRHVTKPDADKVLRATLDALVHARVLHDDSLVYDARILKTYASGDRPIGATIYIRPDGREESEWIEAEKAAAKLRRAQERLAAKAGVA